MVKVVSRNRAGSFQRLMVMTEQEYDELRAASLLQSKKTEPGNSLVEKYLGDTAYPELSTSERLDLYNRAVAREAAARQFTEDRYDTSTATVIATSKPQRTDVPDTKPQSADVPDTTNTTQTADTTQEDVKSDEAQEQDIKLDKVSNTLPNVRVPVVYGSKLATVKGILESSNTVSVDNLNRVLLDRVLLDEKSNYFELMRSLFVNAKKDAALAGRARFLEHLHRLGVSAKHVSSRSAKAQLQHLASQPKQEGQGGKRHTKGSRPPPGKRPKVLLVYR